MIEFEEVTEPDPKKEEVYYRVEGYQYPYFILFRVLRHTPRGVWISGAWWDGRERFILNDAEARFAYPTKEEAVRSFCRRKWRQAELLIAQLKRAHEALSADVEGVKVWPHDHEPPTLLQRVAHTARDMRRWGSAYW